MKKMLLATALALLITGCAQQTFTVQNKPAAVAPKCILSFLRFWELGRKHRCSQNFVAAQKMLLKRNPASIRKWIAQFIMLGIYTPLEALTRHNCISCPSIWATPLLLINILLGSFQLFLVINSL